MMNREAIGRWARENVTALVAVPLVIVLIIGVLVGLFCSDFKFENRLALSDVLGAATALGVGTIASHAWVSVTRIRRAASTAVLDIVRDVSAAVDRAVLRYQESVGQEINNAQCQLILSEIGAASTLLWTVEQEYGQDTVLVSEMALVGQCRRAVRGLKRKISGNQDFLTDSYRATAFDLVGVQRQYGTVKASLARLAAAMEINRA